MYLFYLDESGERDMNNASRYFVLCGLGVPISDWRTMATEVMALKRTYFGDVNVEVKSNWLRQPNERRRRYLDPYGVTQDDVVEFTGKLYDIIESHDVVLMASVIDKERMRMQYANPVSPTEMSYELLFERIEQFLAETRENGLLILDKISERPVQKAGEENLLARQHERFLERGTDFVNVRWIVEGLLFIPSHENHLLQLADLCAYNILRQFRDHGEEWDGVRTFRSEYPFFARIRSKLRCTPGGSYVGVGIKKFP